MGLMHAGDVPLDVADLRWLARRRRQKILGTLDYLAYISEIALRIPSAVQRGIESSSSTC